MTNDALLIALRIKGFAKPDVLSFCLDIDPAGLAGEIERLEGAELASTTKLGVKLTATGQARADAASAAERAACDPAEIDRAYDDFCTLNTPFKALIADWQTRTVNGEIIPNDHSDAAHDAAVIARLDGQHGDAMALCTRLAALTPRLVQYGRRLETALGRVKAGETRFVSAPIIDSYHTVWFELHEDLIRLSGRTRAAEALAGRAV